ncbi:DNA polymerase III subunit gamma/tau [Pusillimonas sp. CC-YST705]|uniref:DNA polymerase III subunit gamma/tau n=1 Tax=Mesopusillimonas faecipullorum TaxID=2755040 RepID=A0ABS8CBM5_9BURK|nr:DNA polymerase III subunit gamma/tau [Mesopusillimonas faecipullorum]MCB5363257.1 DNA polymerase III subunit gamma/tau [Mesopusillimonas faecipullorum]
MSYLVLARKWRPRLFDTLVGQDHVVRALTHALSTQRLHHAWLFTGTRGVGKTTLSRILAKSLNCETGITATPCGVCRACTEIDSGRFVDYVELDAASNRGVDEMTQLLEQAVYAPGVGRFKVYMIDEVHMLSGHAFNAMLKTLEEPPPHVKFILATTDPQKIPVTVLSRCLQFNLKQMTPDAIVEHLQYVLGQEGIPFEVPALQLLARAASGSMRDALSLTDQGIAYSAGNLTQAAIQGMLGTIDQRYLVRLLEALLQASGPGVLAIADELADRGLSYQSALDDLAGLLSRIAILQRVPDAPTGDVQLAASLQDIAQRMHPDLVQLFYSVAVHSRSELALAPDEYAGFVMACLRMLAFVSPDVATPSGSGSGGGQPGAENPGPEVKEVAEATVPAVSAQAATPVLPVAVTPKQNLPTEAPVAKAEAEAKPVAAPEDVPAWEELPATVQAAKSVPARPKASAASEPTHPEPPPESVPEVTPVSSQPETAVSVASEDSSEPPAWLEDVPDDDTYGPVSDDDAYAADLAGAVSAQMASLDDVEDSSTPPRLDAMTSAAWPALAAALPVTGWASELARQSEWLGVQKNVVKLRVGLLTPEQSAGRARLATVLAEHFSQPLRLEIEFGQTGEDTAHAVAQAERAERQHQAELAVQRDTVVQAFIETFDARIIAGSIRPEQPIAVGRTGA